jgi:RNA polymerase-binding protein DksA
MATAPRIPEGKLLQVHHLLTSKRHELATRLSEHRTSVLVEAGPDDEGAEANRNYSCELALSTIDRERRTLSEIEGALVRLEKGKYGVCPLCGKKLPDARLRAIPWARLCVPCAELAAGEPRRPSR